MIHQLTTSQALESFYSVRLAERAAGSGDFGALSTAAVGIGGSPRPRAAGPKAAVFDTGGRPRHYPGFDVERAGP
jgi:hypothetical protein